MTTHEAINQVNTPSSSATHRLPLTGQRLGVRLQPPTKGQHTVELLAEFGYNAEAIEALRTSHTVG